ncbi:MAG TPA: hypothetical protein VGI03_04570 [Verrucomicrobiae bacterium]
MIGLTSVSARAESFGEMLPWLGIGGDDFTNWTDVTTHKNGIATWALKDPAVFTYPQGSKGWYFSGFRQENDSTRDWRSFYGLQMKIMVPNGRNLKLQATLITPAEAPRQEYLPASEVACSVEGNGKWQVVTLPWATFDYDKSQGAFLEFIQALRLSGKFAAGGNGEVKLKDVRLVSAPGIALSAMVQGISVPAGGTASYEMIVGNCTDVPQTVALHFDKYGWETMTPSVTPSDLTLSPGAMAKCMVSVHVPKSGVPPGGHETQTLLATGSDDLPPAKLEFITARDVSRPSILLTSQGWDDVREKAKHYGWAKEEADQYVEAAESWQVPEVATPEQRAHDPQGHPYVFWVTEFKNLSKTATAWQLTHGTNYAEKVAIFLRRLADENTGYPSTFAAVSEGEPQEGENWQIIAIAYDEILDANVLSAADRQSIEHTFRLYQQTVETVLDVGNVGNWNVAANTAALFCSLAMGDLSSANRYLYGPCGFEDYVTKGIMDDGWWWEGSTSYNFWVASELTQSALACQPWGIDLLHRDFPANFSPDTIAAPWALSPPFGISFEKWGPVHHNTRSIKQLWDAVPDVADYRGVAFGMNDGHEEQIGGSRMELAYYAFRDPAYVPLIQSSGQRDLIYGVPELPQATTKPYLQSAMAENLGFALLRSQTTNRPPQDQIQAVFKIGTEGGFHGHFDRGSLDEIARYGRSFWDPESIWWGYDNFMYKFFVQNSVNHNMVVVDQKQQEAVPSSQLLFYSSQAMQVSAQETDARWSDPPYGGMVYDAQSSGGAVADLPALMKRNRQSFPLVSDRQWGDLGPCSDRVLQRRLGIVTDDYVVIADYLKSEQPHTFDDLFQMKGFQRLEAPGKEFERHDAQYNSDPRTSAQFITDCNWYEAGTPALARFKYDFEPGSERGFDQNRIGVLNMDIHSLWPLKQEIMLAQPPENLNSHQWVSYDVAADGKTLASGESGIWILGAVNIDVPVTNAKELTITIKADGAMKKALFLANARFITVDGRETTLGIQPTTENIATPAKHGEDYYGGPVKIAGVSYTDAIPAQPSGNGVPAVIHIPLGAANVVRFKATLGGDYPFGDESDRRRVFAVRSQGTEARFLTVIEPYEDQPMIKSAVAENANQLRIELADGRIQEITIQNLDGDGKDIVVQMTETKDGQIIRQESTVGKK